MPLSVSVVVPVKDEAGNAAPLAREIAQALGPEAEILFVDDGSKDGTVAELTALKSELPRLRVLAHGRNQGQSRAIRSGVRAATGALVATLDGDGQNDPADLPRLVAKLEAGAESLGMVSGVRAKRKDTFSRRLASRLANGLRQKLLGDTATDSGCGIKAFRREAFLALPYFDHQHRFMPTLMQREGYAVEFLPVNHRPRLHGRSKYTNLQRLFAGIFDILGMRWLKARHGGDPRVTEL